jgi:hypothetical protein
MRRGYGGDGAWTARISRRFRASDYKEAKALLGAGLPYYAQSCHPPLYRVRQKHLLHLDNLKLNQCQLNIHPIPQDSPSSTVSMVFAGLGEPLLPLGAPVESIVSLTPSHAIRKAHGWPLISILKAKLSMRPVPCSYSIITPETPWRCNTSWISLMLRLADTSVV